MSRKLCRANEPENPGTKKFSAGGSKSRKNEKQSAAPIAAGKDEKQSAALHSADFPLINHLKKKVIDPDCWAGLG